MSTTTPPIVEIKDDGDLTLPEHLVERIRCAASVVYADVSKRLQRVVPCDTAEDWADFMALRQEVDKAGKVFDTIDYGGAPTDGLIVNATEIAEVVTEAYSTARYEVTQRCEEGAESVEIAEAAAAAADLETMALQIRDAASIIDDDRAEGAER